MNLSFLGLAISALVAVGSYGHPPSKILGRDDQVEKVCADQPLQHISMWRTVEGKSYFICGGVILEENLFLTAAHCLNGTYFPSIRIKAGCVDLKRDGEIRIVNRVYIHTYYSKVFELDGGVNLRNDIAAFTVDTPLVLGPRIKSAKLPPSRGLEIVRRRGEVAGWGNVKRYGNITLSSVLLKTNMEVIPRNHPACPRSIDTHQFCAVDYRNFTKTSNGDSGSPFIIDGTVVGLVCAGNDDLYSADIYTKVEPYLDWIEKIRILNKNLNNGGQQSTPQPKQPTPSLKKLPPLPSPPKKPIPAPKKL